MAITVLIADDQTLVRVGFRLIIEARAGFTVVGEAADGLEAVTLARQFRPDVVLMDIRMPVMDGVEATRLLAASGAAPAPRVIILTTFDLDQHVYDALRAGASGFLLKDTPPDDLITAIQVVAAGEAMLGPSVTRRLLARFARLPAPRRSRRAQGPHRARGRRAPAARPGPLERPDRRRVVHRRDDGEEPRGARPAEAGDARSGAGGGVRLRVGTGDPGRGLRPARPESSARRRPFFIRAEDATRPGAA